MVREGFENKSINDWKIYSLKKGVSAFITPRAHAVKEGVKGPIVKRGEVVFLEN